ncbi:hypothetical protein EHO57_14195 [Leptospira langatensis]|uniref:Uncharacterized protein n=1 Tax=Leptospira langatensis TaxID=2484983 RepID=A0A5R2ASY8_9LEPT|nr:hypothetical protein [Leptospira langatensis]TGJ99905.1 hypothetical protein EHO57_14195 [Leptospira langatensis]
MAKSKKKYCRVRLSKYIHLLKDGKAEHPETWCGQGAGKLTLHNSTRTTLDIASTTCPNCLRRQDYIPSIQRIVNASP